MWADEYVKMEDRFSGFAVLVTTGETYVEADLRYNVGTIITVEL